MTRSGVGQTSGETMVMWNAARARRCAFMSLRVGALLAALVAAPAASAPVVWSTIALAGSTPLFLHTLTPDAGGGRLYIVGGTGAPGATPSGAADPLCVCGGE